MTTRSHIPSLSALGDSSALVVVDDEKISSLLIDSLGDLGFDVQLGFSTDDAIIKLRSHPYSVIIISSGSVSSSLDADQIYLEMLQIQMDQRRKQFVAMIGPNVRTGDIMQAFIFSVDLVFNSSDMELLGKSLTYSIKQKEDAYLMYLECIQTMDIAFL